MSKKALSIEEEFNKKRNKVEILFEALDIMQQYNGRSVWYCIALAMGYETDDGVNFYKS